MNPNPAPQPPAHAAPPPPPPPRARGPVEPVFRERRSWLWRALHILGIGSLVLAILLLAGWAWLAHHASNHMAAAIAAVRAAGQPVMLEDFQPRDIPDQENAAHYLIQSADALEIPSDAPYIFKGLTGDPYWIEVFAAEVAELLELNAETLALIHAARDLREAEWGIQLTRPIINMHSQPDDLSERVRSLARLENVAAIHLHQQGDHAGAIEQVRDHLGLGRAMSTRFSIIAHLHMIAIEPLAIQSVHVIAPTLRISAVPTADAAGASPDAVRALIEDLLDDAHVFASWRQSIYDERLAMLDVIEIIGGDHTAVNRPQMERVPWALKSVARPMLQLDGVFIIEHLTAWAQAGTLPTFPAAAAVAPPEPERTPGSTR